MTSGAGQHLVRRKKPEGMGSLHCCACGRFLGFALLNDGLVEIFCPKCKNWTTLGSLAPLDNGEEKP